MYVIQKKKICFYYAEHKCGFPGCKNVIVLDGNMKNRRDICYAKDAGSIQYPGLPGHKDWMHSIS